MTIRELRGRAIGELNDIFEAREADSQILILLEWVTGYSKTAITMNQEMELGMAETSILLEKIEELKQGKPVQYIIGQSWFHGLEFKVNEQVLIPRPETEELVQWVMEDWKRVPGPKVLDIGTGSGCIAVTLAKALNDPEISAIDIAPGALALAIRNAVAHQAAVEFILMDILDRSKWRGLGRYDIIAGNPPYVRLSEQAGMQSNVLQYEPHAALFVPDEDPLLYYRAIAGFAASHLAKGGAVYVEINENLGQAVLELFSALGFNALKLRKDMQGKDRMIRAVISE